MRPRAHWEVALQKAFITYVPERMVLLDAETWHNVNKAFSKGNFSESEVYAAAWLLLFDSKLWLIEAIETPENSPFRHLADITRDIDQPPLRFAHCIRDLAYGDRSRIKELVAMVNSHDPAYRNMFEGCLWSTTLQVQEWRKANKTDHGRLKLKR
jgi:hypothetical protein